MKAERPKGFVQPQRNMFLEAQYTYTPPLRKDTDYRIRSGWEAFYRSNLEAPGIAASLAIAAAVVTRGFTDIPSPLEAAYLLPVGVAASDLAKARLGIIMNPIIRRRMKRAAAENPHFPLSNDFEVYADFHTGDDNKFRVVVARGNIAESGASAIVVPHNTNELSQPGEFTNTQKTIYEKVGDKAYKNVKKKRLKFMSKRADREYGRYPGSVRTRIGNPFYGNAGMGGTEHLLHIPALSAKSMRLRDKYNVYGAIEELRIRAKSVAMPLIGADLGEERQKALITTLAGISAYIDWQDIAIDKLDTLDVLMVVIDENTSLEPGNVTEAVDKIFGKHEDEVIDFASLDPKPPVDDEGFPSTSSG